MAEAEPTRFRRVAWFHVLGNAAKILVEGTVGLLFGSIALLADAAHSVGDLVAGLVVLIWGGAGYEDADRDHPHGHQRFEPLSAIVVGASIVIMGAYLLLESIGALVTGRTVAFSYALIGALAFAIATMAGLYWYTVRINRALDSIALRALAIDCRNDVLTSGAALAGILGVLAGYPIFDPLAGGLVSVLVIAQGVAIGRENVGYVIGSAAPHDAQREVRGTLLAHHAVEGVHDLVVYYEGTTLEVEGHVEVSGELPLRRAHEIESELVDAVRSIDAVGDAHVHLDPSGIGEWKDADDPDETA